LYQPHQIPIIRSFSGNVVANLFMTEDWVRTCVNAGCVEAATMAGMETSSVVCGFPETINGEYGFEPYIK
jgi:hypothetical protein